MVVSPALTMPDPADGNPLPPGPPRRFSSRNLILLFLSRIHAGSFRGVIRPGQRIETAHRGDVQDAVGGGGRGADGVAEFEGAEEFLVVPGGGKVEASAA